jgi:hypothetical protein
MVLEAQIYFSEGSEHSVDHNQSSNEEVDSPPNEVAVHFRKAVLVAIVAALETPQIEHVDQEQPQKVAVFHDKVDPLVGSILDLNFFNSGPSSSLVYITEVVHDFYFLNRWLEL